MMRLSRKLVIKNHSPLHVIAMVIASCSVVAIITWVYLDESQWSYIKSSLVEAKKSKDLWQENQSMKNTIVNLEERVVMLERTAKVERHTISNLQKDIIKQQDEIYRLKRELEFYQGIMASAGESKGLNIQGLQIEKTSQPRSYYFKLILTHVAKSDKVITGKLTILLEGVQAGSARTIDVRELTLSDAFSLDFKFGSFERVEGGIMLPEGFMAHRVIVRARPEGKKNTTATERVFDWSEAMIH